MRFIRRASVGLMVRAPRPVAIGGITDILLFWALDEGVAVVPAVPLLLLVLPGPRDRSGALDGVKNAFSLSCFEPCPESNAGLFAFPVTLVSSLPSASIPRLAIPMLKLAMSFCSLLDLRTPTLGRLRGDLFSEGSGSTKVPGPIDFRGAFVLVFALPYELGGKRLCLRLLSTGVAGPAGLDSGFGEFQPTAGACVFCLR